MTKASDNQFPKITVAESAAPSTPGAGLGFIYEKTDGILYFKNDGGTETDLTAGAGGISATIVDAKGDLIAGTAADTVARVAVGANDTILMADSAQSTGVKWVASQTPTTQAYSDAAAEGTADTYARGDHKHGMPAAGGATVVYKSADESVSNSTLQDDDHLLFAIGANERWVVQYHLFVTNAANTGDLKMDVTAPAAADVVRYGNLGLALGATAVEATGRAQARADAGSLAAGIVASGTAAENYVLMAAYVDNGANAGNVTLRWAQQTTDGTNATVVKAGSYLVAFKVA